MLLVAKLHDAGTSIWILWVTTWCSMNIKHMLQQSSLQHALAGAACQALWQVAYKQADSSVSMLAA